MIRKGDIVSFKPEWRDPGDEGITFVAVTDEADGRVEVEAQLKLPFNPRQVVLVEWIATTITWAEIDAALDARAVLFPKRPSAVKRGRSKALPYVAVIISTLHPNEAHPDFTVERTDNPLKGYAYETRAQAVAAAQACLDTYRAHNRALLAEPRQRALRTQYGLLTNIDSVEA